MCPSWNVRIEGLGACTHLSHLEDSFSKLRKEDRQKSQNVVNDSSLLHTVTSGQGGGREPGTEPKMHRGLAVVGDLLVVCWAAAPHRDSAT